MIDRTDPTRVMNYLTFPYLVDAKTWQQSAAKVAMIAVHIFLTIITFGAYGYFTGITAIKERDLAFNTSMPAEVDRWFVNNDLEGKYFQFKGDILCIISKKHFYALRRQEKENVIRGLTKLSIQVEVPRYKNELKRIANEICLSINPPNEDRFSKIPKDLISYILELTSPNDIEAAKMVNTRFRNAAILAKIKSINNGEIKLNDILPKAITTIDEALEWLQKDNASNHLRFANFHGFIDFSEKHLTKLMEICPHLTHLIFTGGSIEKIEELPPNLVEFECSCPLLRQISELPKSLRYLSLNGCLNLETLPELPENLKILDCCGAGLISLPRLPEGLEELDCSYCQFLQKIPNWPESLKSFDHFYTELPD